MQLFAEYILYELYCVDNIEFIMKSFYQIFFRGYQKSIIEKELEDQRKDQGKLWQQTKESILEAREILQSSDSITGDLMREKMKEAGKHKNGINKVVNSGHQNGDYSRIPLDESSLDILKS